MMERALKERIIGAIVIVALVILVVPVFLDGPPDNGEIISERVPLPGQSDQQTQTVILARDREEPVPSQSTSKPEPEAQQTASTADRLAEAKVIERATAAETIGESEMPPIETEARNPEPEPKSEPKSEPKAPSSVAKSAKESSLPVPTTTSATGMWAVQLGSFSSQENADRLAASLRKQGFAAFLSKLSTSSGQLHRVRIGPQKDREAAEAMAARLQKAGHKGKVLPHP